MKSLFFALALAAMSVSGCARVQKIVTKVPGATATILPTQGNDVHGSVRFQPHEDVVLVTGRITGLTPGAHGFHIHEKGNCASPDASSAGGHFNPSGAQHAGPYSENHHAGDLGNIIANTEGMAEFTLEVRGLSLGTDKDSIVGRSVIVHAHPDDLATQPSGGSGDRLACGLISRDP